MERQIRFELIFRRYEPAIRAYAARRAGASVAEDVVAEVFVVCWRRLEEMPVDPLPWLLGVARNVLGTQRRGEQRRAALRGRLATERDGEPGDALDLDDGALGEAIARLSPGDRELLLLVAWEELTTEQLAAALDVRASTARVRLMRARRRLRVHLAHADATRSGCRTPTMETP